MNPAAVAILIALTLFSCATHAAQYRITEIAMPPGLTGAIPTSLSNAGEVTFVAGKPVRWSEDVGGTVLPQWGPFDDGITWGMNTSGKVVGISGFHPVLWEPDGTLVTLFEPPLSAAEARAINDRGQVVGRYIDVQNYVAFLWEEDRPLIAIPPISGGHDGWAMDVNNFGQVVGRSDFRGDWRGFFWEEGSETIDVGTLPGEQQSIAFSVNDHGSVVGFSGRRAFIWDKVRGIRSLGALFPQDWSAASAINNLGQVVGRSEASGFLWDEITGMRDLTEVVGDPSYRIGAAYDINDLGQIVAGATREDGVGMMVLLTPIPEPSTIVLAAVWLTVTATIVLLDKWRMRHS